MRKDTTLNKVNAALNDDCDYDKYKGKIETLVEEGNYDQLGEHLLLTPNVVLSMIGIYQTRDGSDVIPLLYIIGETENSKVFCLFYSSMVYFQEMLLGVSDKQDSKDCFLSKYLNFNPASIYWSKFFWGLTVDDVDEEMMTCIDNIVGNKYFAGISDETTIMRSCYGGCFEFLAIVLKHFDKHKSIIKNGLNKLSTRKNQTPLLMLLSSPIGNKEWLDLLFGLYDKYGKECIVDVTVKDYKGNNAIDYCVQRKNEKLKTMVEEYAEKTGQEIKDKDSQK